MLVNLTQKTIDRELRRHSGGPVWLFDQNLPGFALEIRRNAAGVLRATFYARYGGRGRRYTYKIGQYGPVTLERAHAEALDVLGEYARGGNPALERRADRRAVTFAAWVEEYMAGVKLRKRSWKEDQRHLAKAVARWGRKVLPDITSDDIERAFQAVAAAHKVDANRFRAAVSACLQAAWRLGKVPANVALRTRPLPEPPPRTRILSEAELAKVAAAINDLPDQHARAALVLLLATGARRSEVLRAHWTDIDLDQGLWRIPRAKSGRSELIPLAGPVVTMLRKLPRRGALVIPGCNDPDSPRYDLKRPWLTVCEAAGLVEAAGKGKAKKTRLLVRLHDLRRSVGAAVARRHGLHIASKLLRHSDIRVTERHYAPLGIEAIREAAEAQSETLAAVLPMPKVRRRR